MEAAVFHKIRIAESLVLTLVKRPHDYFSQAYGCGNLCDFYALTIKIF